MIINCVGLDRLLRWCSKTKTLLHLNFLLDIPRSSGDLQYWTCKSCVKRCRYYVSIDDIFTVTCCDWGICGRMVMVLHERNLFAFFRFTSRTDPKANSNHSKNKRRIRNEHNYWWTQVTTFASITESITLHNFPCWKRNHPAIAQ